MTNLILNTLGLCCYGLPTLIAGYRNHKSGMAIAFVNVFLGITGIGWIIALIWALTNPGHTKHCNCKGRH